MAEAKSSARISVIPITIIIITMGIIWTGPHNAKVPFLIQKTAMVFMDRVAEMAHLERLYSSPRTEFFVLYGRHRVGKTKLSRAFCADMPRLFEGVALADVEELLREEQ